MVRRKPMLAGKLSAVVVSVRGGFNQAPPLYPRFLYGDLLGLSVWFLRSWALDPPSTSFVVHR